MRRCARFSALWIGLCLLADIAAAPAQDLDAGKSPAQLFSSGCAACHRSPQGLAKGAGAYGLTGFLRQHYTTNANTAAALAGYLAALPPDPRAARQQNAPGQQQARVPGAAPAPDQAQRPADPRERQGARDRGAEERNPRRWRDPRLPMSVASDPEPFIISTAPMALPPDKTPRRRPPQPASAAPPQAAAQSQSDPAAAPSPPPTAPAATAALQTPSQPGPENGAAPEAAVRPAAADQPGFSAPLP